MKTKIMLTILSLLALSCVTFAGDKIEYRTKYKTICVGNDCYQVPDGQVAVVVSSVEESKEVTVVKSVVAATSATIATRVVLFPRIRTIVAERLPVFPRLRALWDDRPRLFRSSRNGC